MKKVIIYAIIITSVVLNIFLIRKNNELENILNNKSETDNTISVVDTIYGRKYIVEVDTITGNATIIGLRHSCVEIEDSIE